uniref:Uncharacterized protein n=1 Tax=Zea mays TaxID=4577 RepID=B6TUP5_MAIZE|nr:hypothetical protein [Zea mays]
MKKALQLPDYLKPTELKMMLNTIKVFLPIVFVREA